MYPFIMNTLKKSALIILFFKGFTYVNVGHIALKDAILYNNEQ